MTGLLKNNGDYAEVKPPSTGLNLGDFHHDRKLEVLDIRAKDVLSSKQLKGLMSESRAGAFPQSLGSSSFDISLSGSYVGVASGEFKATRANKFTVTPGNATLYDAALTGDLTSMVIPAIQKKYPGHDLTKGYLIRSLVEVDSLSYEFTNTSGGSVSLTADPALVKKLTNLGFKVAYTSEKTYKLELHRPMFIGYRLAKVDRNGNAVGVHALPTGKVSYRLDEISLASYPAIDLKASTKADRNAP